MLQSAAFLTTQWERAARTLLRRRDAPHWPEAGGSPHPRQRTPAPACQTPGSDDRLLVWAQTPGPLAACWAVPLCTAVSHSVLNGPTSPPSGPPATPAHCLGCRAPEACCGCPGGDPPPPVGVCCTLSSVAPGDRHTEASVAVGPHQTSSSWDRVSLPAVVTWLSEDHDSVARGWIIC